MLYTMSDVEVIAHGCPVCKGEVSGNDEALFFCKQCNLLFSRKAVRQTVMPKSSGRKEGASAKS